MRSLISSVLVLGLWSASALARPNDFLSQNRAGGNYIEAQPWTPGDGVAPEVQDTATDTMVNGKAVHRSKIRYGKYILPKTSSRTVLSWLSGEPGVMSTFAFGMKKPCEGECALLAVKASLEYANGTEAKTEDGAWLHHMVLARSGTNRYDTACGFPFERIFSSGNERTVVGMRKESNSTGTTAAIQLLPTDSFGAQIELMNLLDKEQEVWLTLTYDYLPDGFPQNWRKMAIAWLDVTGCGPSFSRAPPQHQYTLANTWTSTVTGEMLGAGGHLHDGGTTVTLYKNGGQICQSRASYSAGQSAHGHRRSLATGGENGEHISGMSICFDIGHLKKGDKVEIDASYDLGKHASMKTRDGGESMVMGIALMYIALDN